MIRPARPSLAEVPLADLSFWHEDAVGRARMQMHMVIESRSEAVRKGDGAESRASYARPVAGTGQARRSTKQSFDLFDEDSREGRDCVGPVSEGAQLGPGR